MFPYQDLREYISAVSAMGELTTLKGVDWNVELGELTDVLVHQLNTPMVLFDEIKDYPPGFKVLVNFTGSYRRLALLLGLEDVETGVELVQAWRRKRRQELEPPIIVKNSPVQECIMEGERVNLFKLPTPKWHEQDGGRYLGTASLTITRDPETGTVNLGTYRHQVIDEKTLGCFFNEPGRHALVHAQKYHQQGQSCPVAVVVGGDPLLFVFSSMHVQEGTSEYDCAGGFRGKPVPVFISDLTGLPLPATAEIIIEGELSVGDTVEEGPFGEWTGYYGAPSAQRPAIRVKRIMYRRDPIILGYSPCRPPSNNTLLRSLQASSVIWEALEGAGVPGVKGVWCHESGGGRLFNTVAIRQMYPGHARQAGLIASQCREAIRMGRYVVVTDDDIDIANLHEVVWAMSTRSDPHRSIEIIKRTLGGELNTAALPEEAHYSSRAIIDACKPYEWMDRFAATVGVSSEREREIKRKWRELF